MWLATRRVLTEMEQIMYTMARAAARAVRQDKARWITLQAERVRIDLCAWSTSSLWAWAKRLAGKTAVGGKPCGVFLDDKGTAIATPEMEEAYWIRKFAGESGDRADVFERAALEDVYGKVEQTALAISENDVPTIAALTSDLCDAAGATQGGKAVGIDALPVEVVKYGGAACLRSKRCGRRSRVHGGRDAWSRYRKHRTPRCRRRTPAASC